MRNKDYENILKVCKDLSNQIIRIYSIKKYPEDMSRYYKVGVALDSIHDPPTIFSMGAVIERDALNEIINMFKLGFSLNNIKNLEIKTHHYKDYLGIAEFAMIEITSL